MMDGGMGWIWVWPVLIVLGLLVVGYAVVRLLQGSQGPSSAGPSGSSARRILDERYARGEIDEEEYQRRRNVLP